jgi:hypothetical protein
MLLPDDSDYFWLRNSQMAALEQKQRAEQQRAVAEEQRRLAEENRVRSGRALEHAMNPAEASRDRFESAERQANLVQEQLDATRRTWQEILAQADGKLTSEDTEKMEAAFMMLQERLKQLDEVFQ